jgi:hypothetical protein
MLAEPRNYLGFIGGPGDSTDFFNINFYPSQQLSNSQKSPEPTKISSKKTNYFQNFNYEN